MGAAGAGLALRAGVDDLGGTLMNESITRAAGGVNGQEMTPDRLHALAAAAGRRAWQRTTLYSACPEDAHREPVEAAWRPEVRVEIALAGAPP